MRQILAVFLLLILANSAALAKNYPIFDGRYYNGFYYPRINIIEWQDNKKSPFYLDFHIYEKQKNIEIDGKVITATRGNVLLFSVKIPERNEVLCRRVLAPPAFKAGQVLYFYKNNTRSSEFNSIVISHKPRASKGYHLAKKGKMKNCFEQEPGVLVEAKGDSQNLKIDYSDSKSGVQQVRQNSELTHQERIYLDHSDKVQEDITSKKTNSLLADGLPPNAVFYFSNSP